ncbi:hypothetical protein NPIL_53801 [Nephila pilipes]|uniref:Uncharacterized protein n=1 Tax=Nephila pilipes TaxID=299642 RepID=A0A8X6TYF3_NEPPI|nr:hypothetical protein NPIL_53801 [Nephila pilipes]
MHTHEITNKCDPIGSKVKGQRERIKVSKYFSQTTPVSDLNKPSFELRRQGFCLGAGYLEERLVRLRLDNLDFLLAARERHAGVSNWKYRIVGM